MVERQRPTVKTPSETHCANCGHHRHCAYTLYGHSLPGGHLITGNEQMQPYWFAVCDQCRCAWCQMITD